MRDYFVSYLRKVAKNDKNLIVITADLGFGVFEELFDEIQERGINCGVCEQLMSSMACGLSKVGKRVVTYSIGVFPTLRCLEQIRNDICYHNSDVLISTTGAGFSYGQLGMSHHCIEDIGFTRSIPNLKIGSPGSSFEMRIILENWEKLKSPKYLRIDKSFTERLPIEFDKKELFFVYKKDKSAKKLLIIHGGIIKIFDNLNFKSNLFNNLNIVSVPTLEVSEKLLSIIKSHEYLYTLEEHNLSSGFGSNLISNLNSHKVIMKIKCFGVDNKFTDAVGDQDYLRELYIGKNTDILKQINDDF